MPLPIRVRAWRGSGRPRPAGAARRIPRFRSGYPAAPLAQGRAAGPGRDRPVSRQARGGAGRDGSSRPSGRAGLADGPATRRIRPGRAAGAGARGPARGRGGRPPRIIPRRRRPGRHSATAGRRGIGGYRQARAAEPEFNACAAGDSRCRLAPAAIRARDRGRSAVARRGSSSGASPHGSREAAGVFRRIPRPRRFFAPKSVAGRAGI